MKNTYELWLDELKTKQKVLRTDVWINIICILFLFPMLFIGLPNVLFWMNMVSIFIIIATGNLAYKRFNAITEDIAHAENVIHSKG